jgi:hypothetical protein
MSGNTKVSQKSGLQRVSQWLKNGSRMLLLPLTQPLMAVGIFPAQTLSALKKIPLLNSIISFITRKLGKDPRSAAQTYEEDFKSSPFSNQFYLKVNDVAKIPYTTDFGRTVSLETFSFQDKSFDTIDSDKQYYRIHCSGNSGNCSRFFSELAQLSHEHPELKTITYNHPGVEGSGGITMTQDDLVNALYAQVNALLDAGVDPNHIELTGFSIGAATAALTAEKLRLEGKDVNLFCDRTLSTMPDVVTDKLPLLGMVFKGLKAIPGLKELTHYVLQPAVKYLVIKPLLWLLHWDMNPAAAYNNIKATRKTLTVVKPQTTDKWFSKKINQYLGTFTGFFKKGNGDKTIAPHVSLLAGTESGAGKQLWKAQMNSLLRMNNASNSKPLDFRYISANNAISANALLRLRDVEDEEENVSSADLINLAIVGNKARRLQGTVESDAHNVTADKILHRDVKGGTEGALRASGLREDSGNSLLTYYSMFHKAIKSTNEIIERKINPQL